MTGARQYKLPKNKYCGAELLPKGKKYGTLTECSNAGQIRLYSKADMYENVLLPSYRNLLEYNGKLAEKTGDIKTVYRAFNSKGKLVDLKEDFKKSEKAKKNSFQQEAELVKKAKQKNSNNLDK